MTSAATAKAAVAAAAYVDVGEMPSEYPQRVDMISTPQPCGAIMGGGGKVVAKRAARQHERRQG